MAFFNFQKPAAKPVQQQQQQQPQQQQRSGVPGQQQTQQNPAGKANEPGSINNTGPMNNGQNAEGQQEPNPWSNYEKMFDNSPTEADKPPSFNLDPKMLDDVTSKQDFMQGIDPQLMQRATQGDTTALMEIIHGVGRSAYRTSLEHASLLTDKFVGAREAHSSKGLGSSVKRELTQAALANTPNYKNPVVQKQLSEIATRLSQQHPDASAEEIATMSKDYVKQLFEAMHPADGKQPANGQSGSPVEERGEDFWNNHFASEQQ